MDAGFTLTTVAYEYAPKINPSLHTLSFVATGDPTTHTLSFVR